MGGSKRVMEEQWAEADSVLQMLEDAGAVSRCELHDYVVDNMDSGAAEEVTEQLATAHGRAEAQRLVEAALAEAAMDCPACESNREG